MNIVLLVLVLYLFFLVVSNLRVLVKLLNIRIRPALDVKSNPEDMPDDLRQSLTESCEFIWKNGFQFDHCQKRNILELHDTRSRWYVIYRREETGTYAEVTVPYSPSTSTATRLCQQ